jgi:DNA end-binding protein Ku
VIKSLKPTKTDTINITEFIDTQLIEPIYFEHHYFAVPADAHKAYALFQRALKETNKAAIGQFVMRDKEYACAVQSYQTGLLLSTLNYAYEIRSIDTIAELAHKQPAIQAQELKLAKQFIAELTNKQFDISAFKDTFAQELKKLIKKKAKGNLVAVKKEETKKVSKKIEPTLITALRESLENARIH